MITLYLDPTLHDLGRSTRLAFGTPSHRVTFGHTVRARPDGTRPEVIVVTYWPSGIPDAQIKVVGGPATLAAWRELPDDPPVLEAFVVATVTAALAADPAALPGWLGVIAYHAYENGRRELRADLRRLLGATP